MITLSAFHVPKIQPLSTFTLDNVCNRVLLVLPLSIINALSAAMVVRIVAVKMTLALHAQKTSSLYRGHVLLAVHLNTR